METATIQEKVRKKAVPKVPDYLIYEVKKDLK